MMTDSYTNLPGNVTYLKEGGYTVTGQTNSTITTESMLILGFGKDGPVKVPVKCDTSTVGSVYGSDTDENGIANGATAVTDVTIADAAGCEDVRFCKLTGSPATLTLNAASSSVPETNKVEDDLGGLVANGCAETVLTLLNKPLVPGSVKCYTDSGRQLSSILFSEDDPNGKVTIKENALNGGVYLTVNYDYTKTNPVNKTNSETVNTVSSGSAIQIALAHQITDITNITSMQVTVGNANVDIAQSELTLGSDHKTITIAAFDGTHAAAAGDSISVNYTYTDNVVSTYHASETGTAAVPFITTALTQSVVLSKTPIADSIHVYQETTEIVNSSAFEIDYSTNTLKLHDEYFTKDIPVRASYLTNTVTVSTATLNFESFYASSIYNKGTIEVREQKNSKGELIGKTVIITKPDEKKATPSESPLTYDTNRYITLRALADAINADSNNGIYKCTTADEDIDSSTLTTVSPQSFTGGDDGLNASKEEVYEALNGKRNSDGEILIPGVYQMLESYKVDKIVLSAAFADDYLAGDNESFAYTLGLFASVLSLRNKLTDVYIAVKPARDTRYIQLDNYVDNLAKYTNVYYMKDLAGNYIKDTDGAYIDLGKTLSVVCGPDVYYTKNGRKIKCNPAVFFCALCTTLGTDISAMNQAFPTGFDIGYTFTALQLNSLTGNNMVTFNYEEDDNKNMIPTVVDAMSAAGPNSPFQRWTSVGIAKYIINGVNKITKKYSGKSNRAENVTSMNSEISKFMSDAKNSKQYITYYAFQLQITQADQQLGKGMVLLDFICDKEFRKISTVCSVG